MLGLIYVALSRMLQDGPGSQSTQQIGPTPDGTADQPLRAYIPLLPAVLRDIPVSTPDLSDRVPFAPEAAQALAIAGTHLYLGVGSTLVTYDISGRGAARLTGRSEPVEGHIVRVAVGLDRLFTLSRPEFDGASWDREHPGGWDPLDLPPWTIVSVFDVSDPAHAKWLQSIPLRVPVQGRVWDLYAADLTAWDRLAYLIVGTDFGNRFAGPGVLDGTIGNTGCGNSSACGLMLVDGGEPQLAATLRNDLVPSGSRLLAANGRLYVAGRLPPEAAEKQRASGEAYFCALMSFDLGRPAEPVLTGWTGRGLLDAHRATRNLAGWGTMVYRVVPHNRLDLLAASSDAAGAMRLVTAGQPRDPDYPVLPFIPAEAGFPKLYRTAAEQSRLHLLLPDFYPAMLISVDVQDPLRPRRFAELRLTGVDLRPGLEAMEATGAIGDVGSDLGATQDGRLFVAGGESGLLIEVEVSREGAEKELARYDGASGASAPK